MKRVYVAGSYSANKVMKVLDNMRTGMRAGTEVFLMGFAPFVPWHDYHFQLQLRPGEELSIKHYYRYSMAWLEVSDAVLVLPNSGGSHGTIKEIEKAKELHIPIFYDKLEMAEYLRAIEDSDHLRDYDGVFGGTI